MIIRNVSSDDLNRALDAANRQYSNNIRFKRRDLTSKGYYYDYYTTPASWRVTLTVADSTRPGARRSTNRYRADGERSRIAAACWHAHGAFMQALPSGAVVISSPAVIDAKPTRWSPGDEFQDFSIGSMMYPCMASEACEC